MEKKRLRKQISQDIAECSADELQRLSHYTSLLVLVNEAVLGAQTVVAFWPMPDEVDIRYAIRTLYAEGKTILLPHVINDTDMELRKYEGDDTLRPGAYGILEPTGSPMSLNGAGEDAVVLVPGRAFDLACNRLGRGKGYYDRFLANYPQVHTIGVCYYFQIIDNVPTNQLDIPINELIWKISKS